MKLSLTSAHELRDAERHTHTGLVQEENQQIDIEL